MPNFAPSKRKVKEMKATKRDITQNIIDKLLTSCQSESKLISNFAPLKQKSDNSSARSRHNQTKFYQGVITVTKS